MERNKNVILVSHCILNQNSVVLPLARAKGGYNKIIETLLKNSLGILQLPCPEILHLGLKRAPMTKEEYDTAEYRNLCVNQLESVMTQLKYYLDAEYNIVGLIGIDQSPTCSLKDKGIMMEELFKLLGKENIKLESIAVPTDYMEDSNTEFVSELEEWLEGKL